jgi:hypothetical protein
VIRFEFHLAQPVPNIAIRLGPFPRDTSTLRLRVDSQRHEAQSFVSGDSCWVWVRGCSRTDGLIQTESEA